MKIFTTLLIGLLSLGFVRAQTPTDISIPTIPLDSALDSELRINMAIPSSPAFQILGGEPSNLLRVSNPKEFSLAISDFFSNGSVVIPQNFGVDFSPYMVLENGGLLSDTSKASWLRPLRISMGTKASEQDSLGISKFAEDISIGLQYTYTKPGSSFQGYKNKLRNALQPMTNDYESRVDSLRKVYYRKKGINITQVMATLSDDSLVKFLDVRNAWTDSVYNTLPSRISGKTFDVAVSDIKTQFKREAWNDFRIDLASAIKLTSPDTLLTVSLDSIETADTTVTFEELGVWGTVSFPLFGTNWIQGMAGGNYTLARVSNADFKSIYSLSTRFYVGTNRLKGFFEAQYSGNEIVDVQSYLWSLGAEINFIDGIWLNFYAGLSQDIGAAKNRVVTQFNLHFTLPESFNLN